MANCESNFEIFSFFYDGLRNIFRSSQISATIGVSRYSFGPHVINDIIYVLGGKISENEININAHKLNINSGEIAPLSPMYTTMLYVRSASTAS